MSKSHPLFLLLCIRALVLRSDGNLIAETERHVFPFLQML